MPKSGAYDAERRRQDEGQVSGDKRERIYKAGKMNPRSPPSTTGYPSKRARHSSPDRTTIKGLSPKSLEGLPDVEVVPITATGNGSGGGGKAGGQSSSFRNVSACNRCRLRKNRCDQRLPSCASCEKASVKCVGYDPITKREIPRR